MKYIPFINIDELPEDVQEDVYRKYELPCNGGNIISIDNDNSLLTQWFIQQGLVFGSKQWVWVAIFR